LAMGYSRAQVAQTLAISEHTLRVYVESELPPEIRTLT